MNVASVPKLPTGSKLQVGKHQVSIVKYISEGGFAQIYEVLIDYPENESQTACLKRVIVPDKNGLDQLRKEVEVMKCLRSARSIVSYYDSHAARLDNVNYQVLVLMELCPGGSLLDFMNARIKVKLNEGEILKIMLDVCQGVYEMHRAKLIHRDIKIENVLINKQGSFKLCDFGSTSVPISPPQDQQQFKFISHDILYHTTPQYRSPEMVDLYRAKPIDEKADIWALGCFLFKLCYYTTPFEANGDIALLHASFQFPPSPQYSGDLKNLVIIMLQENPLYRPNIVQVLMLICKLSSIKFEALGLKDFYNLGPYSFEALQEYQLQKQNQALQEKQLYIQQQRMMDPIEAHNPLLPQVQPVNNEPAPPAQKKNPQTAKSDENATEPIEESDEKSNRRTATDNKANPEVVTSPSSTMGFSSDESDGLSELEQLDDAEERYPSLEHIDILDKANSVSSKVSKASSTSKSGEPVAESATKVKSNLPPKIETDTEKLADDIFAKSNSSNTHNDGFSLSQPRGVDSSDTKSGYISDPAGRYTSSYPENNNSIMTSNTGTDSHSIPRPVNFTSSKSANFINPDAHKNNNPWVGKETKSAAPADSNYHSSASYSKAPWVDQPTLSEKGANSPEDARSPNLSSRPQFAYPNASQNVASDLSNYKPQRERNLIDLEVGLPSSNSSSTELGLNNQMRSSQKNESNLSLIDLNINDEKQEKQFEHKQQTTSKSEKPVFKKRIPSSSNHSQLFLQEEVIDFASDDENIDNGSDMSRLKIRNSLKKPKGRKSGELKRPDSLQESKKRHSFFGGS